MKTNPKYKRGFTLVELLVVIVIIASLAALSTPMIMGQLKKAARTQATSNAKQIGIAMFTFEQDYGSYPDSVTLEDLTEAFPDATITGEAGTDSNGYFKQLLHAGIAPSEEIFYAKAAGTKEPDGDISTAEKALEEREVGFGYIMDGDSGMSTAGNPSRVIVVTPLAENGTDFDADPFDKQAVVLKIDQSVTNIPIRPAQGASTGPAIIGNKPLLEAEFWGDAEPTIKPPKR